MKKVLLFTFVTLISSQLLSQNFNIKGRVLSGKESIEYANILLQTEDSVFVTGGVTDQNGRFAFNNLEKGDYILKISSLGYSTYNIPVSLTNENTVLSDIQLDSASVALDEVVVKASCVVNGKDRKIYLPTSNQIKASTNGMDILMQMKLNRLQVDPMNRKITSSNPGEVQLRINGNKSDINEVQSLRPDDIQRIEYHEDPSLKYGDNVAVVIDYITKQRISGGYIGLDTQNSPFVAFGNNGLNGKFNYKNSEWGFNYWGMYRDLQGYWRDNYESFNYDDGSQFIRREIGEPGVLTENHHYLSLTYSYRNGEKWSFYSRLKQDINVSGMLTKSYLYPEKQKSEGVNMVDDTDSRNSIPSLDLYFQRKYPHKQTLLLNAVFTYINSNNSRDYVESRSGVNLTDITSRVNGDKYSFIGEGIYEKEFTNGTFSTGFNLYQEYNRDKYSGNVNSLTNFRATYLNFYAEWSAKIKKFNYRVAIGAVDGRYSQNGNVVKRFLPTTKIRLGYNANDNFNIRLNGSLSYNPPELGDMGDVCQIIDSLQIRKGNPNLRESTVYVTNLALDYRKGIFSTNLNIYYQNCQNAMMESIYFGDNHFIHTVENQKSWQKVNPQLEFKVGPIKDILNVSVATGVNYYDSKGLNYHHNYTNWYYRIEASAMYKNWMAYFTIQNQQRTLYGETIYSDEAYHILMLRYKYKDFTFGVMTLNTFNGKNSYKRPTDIKNKNINSKSCWYLSDSNCLCVATVTWNFSFGRKFKSVEKLLNNEDTKTGSMKTGK